MAERILAQIDDLFAAGNDVVVADGLYSWTEYKIFKKRFGDNAVIVAIAAPRKLRHERLSKRSVRPYTNEEVTAREYAEIENIEKGGPIANADYTIVNNSTTEDMLAQLQDVLKMAAIEIYTKLP
jgi:dephospho-CoA kinase